MNEFQSKDKARISIEVLAQTASLRAAVF